MRDKYIHSLGMPQSAYVCYIILISPVFSIFIDSNRTTPMNVDYYRL